MESGAPSSNSSLPIRKRASLTNINVGSSEAPAPSLSSQGVVESNPLEAPSSYQHPIKKRKKAAAVVVAEDDSEAQEYTEDNGLRGEDGEEDSESEEDDPQQDVYCICRRPDIPGTFMIGCDECNEWFHGKCVNISQDQAATMQKYVCAECVQRRKEKEALHARVQLPKCAYKSCFNVAKSKSKYCCDACGIKAAKELLEHKAHSENKKKVKALQHNLLSAADTEDFKSLEEIERKKKEIKQRILILDQKEKELDTFIDFAATVSVRSSASVAQPDKDLSDERTAPASLDIMDCITCGQPIAAKNYSRHIESCFSKKQGSQTGTGRVKDTQYQICGCPTTDFESGYCERSKRSCGKHVNWETLRKAHVLQEKIRESNLLASLVNEEKIITARLTKRNSSDSSTATEKV